MTPDAFLATLDRLGYKSQAVAARLFGVHVRTVERWCAGQYPIPAEVEAWLRRQLRHIEADPPPQVTGGNPARSEPPPGVAQRLAALDLSPGAFARMTGANARTVRRWCDDTQDVPGWVWLVLDLFDDHPDVLAAYRDYVPRG